MYDYITILKNISQWEGLIPIYGKIKNVPNHQPDWVSCEIDTLLDLLLCPQEMYTSQ